MNADLQKASRLLHDNEFTCVLCAGDSVYTTEERGVAPLLNWISDGTDLHGFSAADKVIGKAAALLYVLLGIRAVYAPVMSESAIYTLARHGIQANCDVSVKVIRNRDNTGMCPMEMAVENISDPQEALNAIRDKRLSLRADL